MPGEAVNLGASTVNPQNDAVDTNRDNTVTLADDPGINRSEAERFLSEVFGKCGGVIEVAAFLEGSRKPEPAFRRLGEEITKDDGTVFRVTPELISKAVEAGDKGITRGGERKNIDAWYVRMTTLAAEPVGFSRGGASNIREFTGFWLDGDYAVEGHHKTEGSSQVEGAVVLPPDAATVRALWTDAGYPEPTITWLTGGGINGAWLLHEPLTVEDGESGRETYRTLKAASKRWHERVRMIALTQGYHHDTTHNLDRLVRLPGSVNRKVMHHPKAVTAVYEGPRYSLEELMAYIPEPVRTEDGALIDPVSGQMLREAPERTAKGTHGTSAGAPIEGLAPWDDFDARADWWTDVLSPIGWQHHGWAGQVEYLTRPGKEPRNGLSATLNHDGLDKLYIFSDAVLRTHPSVKDYQGEYLTKSKVLCHMAHGGDWSALARDLRARGYGEALPDRSARSIEDVPDIDLFAGQTDAHGHVIDGAQNAPVRPVGADASAQQGGTFDGAQIVFRRASQVRLRRTLWMWDTTPEGGQPTSGGRIPIGMLTVAAGLPGTGKSQWAIWLTAQITKGTLPGEHYGQAKNVIYAATEDDWERTIAPRLVAAGADLDRVFHVMVRTIEMKTVKLSVPDHCGVLGQFAESNDVALVVLDPLLSHLGGKINANAEREVRDALEPLVRAAAKYNFTVVGLSHFNKNSGNADPMERLMGSRGFSALLRALIVFAKDKDAEEGDDVVPMQKFVLSQAKNNLGRTDMPSYQYTIMPSIVDTEEGEAYVSRFALGPESETSVEEQLATAGRSPEEAAAGQDCKTWLKGYLQHHGGEDFQRDIQKAAEKEGFSRATLYRAKTVLKVIGTSTGFGGAKVAVWRLPGAITSGKKADAQEQAVPLHATAPRETENTGSDQGKRPSHRVPEREEWTVERIPAEEFDRHDEEKDDGE